MDREEAARLYDRVLEHQKNGDGAAALTLLDRVLASYPAMAALHLQRGALLSGMKQFGDALASFDIALGLDPLQAEAHFGRGAIFQAQGKPADALGAYERALQIQPAHVRALNNRALALRQTGNLAGALQSYDAAIALMPDYPDFRFGKAMCLLQLGRFEEGWRLYEWRKAMVDSVAPPRGVRPWRGEALAGKTLLIQAEQGLGDTIQFCRFAALAQGEGAHVVLQVQDKLTRLLETLPFPATVIGAQNPPPPCDYHVLLMSLPFHRGGVIPAHVPYLAAEAQRTEAWRTRIGTAGLKIGISWQGEEAAAGDVKAWDTGRSFPLFQFENIAAMPDVRLISLQKNEGVEQLDQLAGGMRVETLGDDFDAGEQAFLDTAAAMQSLDLVITADTAIAHLAGALGRPVWLALNHAADWRWLVARQDSPWYPTMQLFRQTVPGDWRGPFDRMAAALHSSLGGKSMLRP